MFRFIRDFLWRCMVQDPEYEAALDENVQNNLRKHGEVVQELMQTAEESKNINSQMRTTIRNVRTNLLSDNRTINGH